MTYATERARTYNQPCYFVHVEGLPYLWFTKVPANWTAPDEWTYASGLMLKPGGDTVDLAQDLDPLGGVQDPETVSFQVNDPAFTSALGGTARGVKGTSAAYLATNDVDPNDDSDLETDVAMDGAPAGTLFDDQFSDASISGDWTTEPGAAGGTVTETGGNLEIAATSASWRYWHASLHLCPAAQVSLSALGASSAALFCAETAFEITTSGLWADHGLAVMEDWSNAFRVEVGNSGGMSYEPRCNKGEADSWTATARDGGGAITTPILRLYWNTHATETFETVNGDTLGPDGIRAYISRDSGATWTAIAAADTLDTISPDYVRLYSCTTQPGYNVQSDHDYLTITETDVDGAETLIYIGNQTTSYTKRDGVTYSGVDRGRFHALDGDLAEVEHKPQIKWSSKLDVAPWVTTFPRTILGRVVTLYRVYLDGDGNGPTDKAEHAIRFRGPISAVGDGDDHLGTKITCTGLIDLLDAEIYSTPFEAPLRGYSFRSFDYVNPSNNGKIYIRLREQYWILSGASTNWKLGGTAFDASIEVLATSKVETANELANAIDAALIAAGPDGTGKLRAPWRCYWVTGNRYVIGFNAVGYDTSDNLLVKGAAHSVGDFEYGIKGSVFIDDALAALGFGKPDGRLLELGKGTGEDYRDAFARWTNPTAFVTFLVAGNVYRLMGTYADDEAAQAWFRLDSSTGIPIALDSGSHDFEETPGDGSPFVVMVDDRIIYNAAAVDSVSEDIWLDSSVGAASNFNNPIGAHAKQEDRIISIPKSMKAEDVPTARQAWIPSCEQSLELSGGLSFLRRGIEHMLLHLMLSTGEGAGYNSDWDRLPREWALGIPESYVDTASFENLAGAFGWAARQRKYIFTEGRNFRELLEEECKSLGFLVVTKEGKIAAVPQRAATAASAVATIDDSSRVLEDGDYSADWQTAPEGIVNALKLDYDYDVIDGDFYRHLELLDLASQADYRTVQTLEIENKGVRSADWRAPDKLTVGDLETAAWDRLADWSQETYIYTTAINRSLDNLTVGDPVLVTDSRIPNPYTGTRGIVGHPGIVQAFAFDDLEGVGSVTVRLNYQNGAILTIPGFIVPNAANIAYGAEVTGGGAGTTLIVNPGTFQKNSTAEAPTAGDLMKVQVVETGEAYEFTVTDYDAGTGEITTDRAVAWEGDDGIERVVTWTKFSRAKAATTTGREFRGAFLADGDGLVGGEKGYRQL